MNKKPTNKFKIIFYILLISFCIVYASGKTGYYEANLHNSTLLTNEAIKEFEKDISEGKAVDIKDYIKADIHDYRNGYSKLGFNISKTISTILTEGFGKITQFLKALFT